MPDARPQASDSHGLGYVHALPGRVRLKVAGAKRDPSLCREIEDLIARMEFVSSVKVNVTTGNALIIHDRSGAAVDEFVEVLRSAGLLDGTTAEPVGESGMALRAAVQPDRPSRRDGVNEMPALSQRTTEAVMACAIEVLLKIVIAGLG